MKLIALSAALALSSVAYAQDTTPQQPAPAPMDQAPAPTDPAASGATPQMQQDPRSTPTTPTQPMASAPDAANQTAMAGNTGGTMTGTETKGGYMPSTPPLSGTPQPGSPVRVQASMSPDQAFPPPAPKAEYPICKKGQTDECRQRGGK